MHVAGLAENSDVDVRPFTVLPLTTADWLDAM